jgi:hypothetical protein
MTAQGGSVAARDGAAAGKAAMPFGDPAAADAAHKSLKADQSIQFDFPWFIPEQRETPEWIRNTLRALGNFIDWVGGGWTVIMWIAIALVVIALAFAIFPPLRAWLADRLAARAGVIATPGWVPEVAVARALLVEADQLAAAGRYDEAVRLLLHRSVEDIERWRGDPLRPSWTSRDIARIDALPDAARTVFGRIVADVERSLFAGHPLGEADWARARADYAGFALGR